MRIARIAFSGLFTCLLVALPLLADGGANHQVQTNNYGSSGGNVNDITRAFCCSGTLGSLVRDSAGTLYILSNNHVLARVDQAAPGEDVSQPGLIDSGCQPIRIVADFSGKVPLGNNVDAAVAALRSGTMNTTGSILDVGIPSSVVKAATVGLAVAKSGRTTGFTTGSISSVNTSVSVQYQKKCGAGKKFVITYTNQVVINSSTFSAGGDSGSLIVSNTNSACRQPVALLFAGSSTTTIGNPIGEVVSKLGSQLGTTFSFVGQNCTAAAVAEAAPRLSDAAIERATVVKDARVRELMALPGVIAVGVGASLRNPSEAAVMLYVDKTKGMLARMPRAIDGIDVRVIGTDPIIAF